MFKLFLNLILAVSFFAASAARADATSLSKNLNQWLSKNLQVSLWCGDETDQVRKEFTSAVRVGMARLYKINPRLTETLFTRRMNSNLLLVCGEMFTLAPTQQSALYFPGLLHHKIYLGTDKNRAYLRSENMVHGVQFHEFLHFLKMDSVSKATHNSMHIAADAVYICGMAAFPEELSFNGDPYYSRMQADPGFAAAICSSASLRGDRVEVPRGAVCERLGVRCDN